MRKFFAKIHLWLSVPLGILVSIICLSGATLVFEQEITRALDPQLYRVAPPEGVQPLAPSQLAARIREQMPDTLKLSSLQLSGDPREACMAGFEGSARRTLSVNPYTGEVNGWTKKYGFFQTTRKLHRWLMDAPAAKGQPSIGKGVVGVTTLLLVVILVSGLAIWVPRTRKALKQRLKVSCTNGWRRFWYDSHTVLGFYAALFLLAMALTGLTWSFGWYREAAYSLFGGGAQQTAASSQPAKGNSVRPARGGEGGRGVETAAEPFDYAVWDGVLDELKVRYPVYKTITLNERNARIVPDPHTSMRRTDTARFDPRDGRIEGVDRYRDAPRSQSLRGWFYAFHTGSWGGMTTKILYFLSALIGGTLPLTGYYLWLKKRRRTAKK